jgi:N-acetylmuramoyl-L-alanine amidase
VHMTRTDDDDLATELDRAMRRRQSRDLRNRTRFALQKAPDAFVSIHCNSVPSSHWHGAQTIYMKGNPDGEALAKTMQSYFHTYLLPTSREADDMSTLYLLKRINGPAVLAEIGFLSNTKEAVYLVHPSYQRRVAFAIYLSLLDYFGRPQAHLAEE